MKFFAVISFALAPLAGIAQTKIPVPEKQSPKPDYFIDSIKVNDDYIRYINPMKFNLLTLLRMPALSMGLSLLP
ncbi:hypothetical protein [Mucilaginibacter sp. SP1R1]|uniref:hypothetical protein n=1 Tax=Mucilaginibacter sp. SP1R1 TaxID=2723091 RepID=UPI00160D839B|nr:hypothetical protein [Mucilaginibacter sp. SP1R1]MBB6151228.1 hypothetical protein [Mucilaginibacter sp. SP1R1]